MLWRPRSIDDLATEIEVDARGPAGSVDDARATLFEAREARVHPATDDKVLAAWNGMAIGALAEAGRVLGESRYIASATGAATFVFENLRGDDGRLLRSWRDGAVGTGGFLDDHALLASACLTLYETTFDLIWFERASELVADMRRLFADPSGGFFQTGSDADALLVRPKELYDNATPSGSSTAADVLLRLASFTGDAELERDAVSALRLVSDGLGRAPGAFGHALCALDRLLGPHRQSPSWVGATLTTGRPWRTKPSCTASGPTWCSPSPRRMTRTRSVRSRSCETAAPDRTPPPPSSAKGSPVGSL